MATPIPYSDVRRIAVAASCDPRSVVKVARGETVKPLTKERILAAIADLGLSHLLPPEVRDLLRGR